MTLYRAGYLIFRATHSHFETFERNIGLLRKICTTENINSLAVQKDVVDANFWLDEVVNALNENNFFLMFFSRKSCSSYFASGSSDAVFFPAKGVKSI